LNPDKIELIVEMEMEGTASANKYIIVMGVCLSLYICCLIASEMRRSNSKNGGALLFQNMFHLYIHDNDSYIWLRWYTVHICVQGRTMGGGFKIV